MRQFDASLNKLSQVFFAFLTEHGITSSEETVALLEALKSKLYSEFAMASAADEAARRFQTQHQGGKAQ